MVPAHDERDRLPECLASLALASERVPVPVTVVVVLDACTDGSGDVVPDWVQTVAIAERNVGAARRAGFALMGARPDRRCWYATTDADSVVPQDWLARHLRHARDGADAVVGTVGVDWRHHPRDTQRTYERLYARHRSEAEHGHVHGANLGFTSDAYWKVGGFQSMSPGEDVDFVDRLTRIGARLVWDTRNRVVTSDRPDPRARGGFGDFVGGLAGQQ